jgi:hypothetical protein
MPTTNPRIHITLDESITNILSQLAKKEHKSVAGVTKELILEALARREDVALSAMAEIRDKPKTKRIKHDDAWK